MSYTKNFENLSKNDVAIAGGKGASLGEMTRAGLHVPPGFVVLAAAFDRFLEETDLDAEIEARLKEVNKKDLNSVDKASNYGFAQAVASLNYHLVGVFGYRVHGEGNSGNFALHHFLHYHSHRDLGFVEFFLKAVKDCAGSKERRPAFHNLPDNVFFRDIQVGFQFTSPGGGLGIFGGSRGAHGHKFAFQFFKIL